MRIISYLLIISLFFNSGYASKKHRKHRHAKHHTNQTINRAQEVDSTISEENINKEAVEQQPYLYSYSVLAMNADNNDILVKKHPNMQLPIASITKLMTAMVLLDADLDMDDYITISSADIDYLKNTSSRLRVGMQMKRKNLLLLALMSSENRAAHALARTTFEGGTTTFVRKMNEKARSLGMVNTVFYDPTGLTSENQSTAEDLSKMVQAAFKYNLIRKFTTTRNADVLLAKNYIHRYVNTDILVRKNRFSIDVSKTGYTNEAGHCLVLYTYIKGKPIIMVFLNSSGPSGRIIDAIAIRNYIRQIY